MTITPVDDEAVSSLALIASGSGERRQRTPAKWTSSPPSGPSVNVNLWTTDLDGAPSVLSPALNTRSRTLQRSIAAHMDEHHNDPKNLFDAAEDGLLDAAFTLSERS